jgi:aspartyl-tRNA(Asn)/glutamyl-tRNA(Gln) amidotransferase subunit B
MLANDNKYLPIIGLEIHVELRTDSKMFCGCSAQHFGVEPNTHTCPVCLGLPGALPVPNQRALEWCQLIGAALSSQLSQESKFDRKNYFYPDLPKGYQISQYDQPLCINGEVSLSGGKIIGITRVHMEEDTGKLVHTLVEGRSVSLVDFNRSGVPLVEIVTEPDFRSIEEVDEFLKKAQQIVRYLGVSDCDMEKGSMRLEVNMSLRRSKKQEARSKGNKEARTSDKLPAYKVEIKNINSFRFVRKAIEYEYQRQAELLDSGETPDQETRGYSEAKGKTLPQRSKEEAHDYRYFPEPDIPPLKFTPKELEAVTQTVPELPNQKLARFKAGFKLGEHEARILVSTREIADYFEEAVRVGQEHNLTAAQLAKVMVNKKVDIEKHPPANLVKLLVKGREETITDQAQLRSQVQAAIAANPQAVQDYRAGKTQVIGVFVGAVMRTTGGKADAQITRKFVEKLLEK